MGIKVITAPTLEPITLAELKAQTRVDGSDEDTLLGQIIMAARSAAEQYMNAAIMARTLDATLDAFPGADADIRLPVVPAWNYTEVVPVPLALVSVKYIDTAGAEQTLDPAAYTLDDSNWPFWTLRAVDTDWPATRQQANAVTIRYTVGYDTQAKVPGTIRAWLLMTGAFMHASREAFVVNGRIAEIPTRFMPALLDPFRVFGV